jgi:predicted RNA-binding Zn ribbon-like protein
VRSSSLTTPTRPRWHVVVFTGARPVFVDVRRDTGTIDVNAAEAALTPRTRGVVAASSWPRLRACPDCRWVFYDTSRNGRRVWCSMTGADGARACGSIAKTRRPPLRAPLVVSAKTLRAREPRQVLPSVA